MSACGGGTKTVTQSSGGPVTGATGLTTGAAAHTPNGALDLGGVGPAVQGMSAAEVTAVFGKPDKAKPTPGCELYKHAPQELWTWSYPDGKLVLTFDKQKGLIAYSVTTPRFATSNGDRVGDAFSSLKSSWGSRLKPLNLGSVPSTAQTGPWRVAGQDRSSLIFQIEQGKISQIQGGDVQVCE
jgi:hypothetical protein